MDSKESVRLHDTTLLLERNISQAIVDYGAHTYDDSILRDVSGSFITALAKDAAYAKHDLRELFRQSSAWDESLQSLVINGTKTHNPDYGRIEVLARAIISPYLMDKTQDEIRLVHAAMKYFYFPEADDELQRCFINAIQEIAPKAYRENRKKSRIFKALCDALGLTDYSAGSEFQRLYAQIADELSAKKLDFKLFVSINPAHFITMSNPKRDNRGAMLTSCHSFNSTEYTYNNGCSGYARDDVTMIVFTVDDPTNPELLNNRKTTRQLFMYKVGNGVLLQSRMYNSNGGVYGASELTPVYRDLIQRELSELEGVPNLWKTYAYCKNKPANLGIYASPCFGGYPDWTYSEFDAKISLRLDHVDNFKTFEVGNYGLCVKCGREISDGLYCDDCKDGIACDHCGAYCDEDDLYTVHDEDGGTLQVCECCLEDDFTRCAHCEEYFFSRTMTDINEYDSVCPECLEEYYGQCDDCGGIYRRGDLRDAYDAHGREVHVCESCLEEEYGYCEDCGDYYHTDLMEVAFDQDGYEVSVCYECAKNNYTQCEECDQLYPDDCVVDGLCPKCRSKENEEQETTA